MDVDKEEEVKQNKPIIGTIKINGEPVFKNEDIRVLVQHSKFLQDLMETDDDDEDGHEEIDLFDRVTKEELYFAKRFYIHHEKAGNEYIKPTRPLGDIKDPNVFSAYDYKLTCDLTGEQIVKMVNAMNYLCYEDIVDMLCIIIVDKIRGKTPEEIKLTLS